MLTYDRTGTGVEGADGASGCDGYDPYAATKEDGTITEQNFHPPVTAFEPPEKYRDFYQSVFHCVDETPYCESVICGGSLRYINI